MAIMKLQGEVKEIGELKKFSSGFQKRDLVVEEIDEKAKYPAKIPFTFKKDKVSLIDNIKVGDKVAIDYVYSSRDWDDPKTGETRHFVSFDALKVKVTYSAPGGSAASSQDDGGEDMPDDIPL